MSAGKFDLFNYVTNAGHVVAIKLQPETLEATIGGSINASPPGTVDSEFPSALVSKSRRAIGIHPRTVTIRSTGSLATGYKADQLYTIVVCGKTVWDGIAKNQAANYLGGTGKVVSKTDEKIN